MKKTKFVVLTFLFSLRLIAASDVILKDQIQDPPLVQSYGACHVYGGVAAAEAACARKTKNILPISAGFLYYRHLRSEIVNPASYPFLIKSSGGLFSENDAGEYTKTVERIIAGESVLSNVYDMANVKDSLTNSINFRDDYLKLVTKNTNVDKNAYEKQMRDILAKDLDTSFVRSSVASITDTDSGLTHFVNDDPTDPLYACQFSQMSMIHFNYSPELAAKLIDHHFPFICQFVTEPEKVGSGSHVVMFMGYHRDDNQSLNFFVRDSRYNHPYESGWKVTCSYATVVANENEVELVNQIIRGDNVH